MDHQAIITESDLERILFDETAEPMPLPFSLLERITNGFSYKMEVGKGGFAVVYEGKLEKGVVAIKRLTHTYMYENEFFREVECLMKVKHRNIVRFLGYCVDTQGKMTMHEGKYVMVEIHQRLLCFEYVPNGGLDHYIKDPSRGLGWTTRYDIIKGICEGLYHLHQLNIVHLDLKPANILLDENMEPKITDFGTSRSFLEDETRVIATKVIGTTGYMAPEFVSHLITKKYDLYSLGVIIMEILTGQKRCQGVETVLESWSDRLNISRKNQEYEQIRLCVEIGIQCTDFDPANRPDNIKHIIERLSETEIEVTPGSSALLDVHPLELRFRFEPNKLIPCSLELTNNTDEQVFFQLMKKTDEHTCFLNGLPVFGTVEPATTCTLIVIMKKHKNLPQERNVDLILRTNYEDLSKEKLGNTVHKVTLQAVCAPQGETIFESIPPSLKIILMEDKYIISGNNICSMDANPTEPVIIIGHDSGHVLIWNYDTQKYVGSIQIQNKAEAWSVKFIERKGWCLVGSIDGFIHVYDYKKEMKRITSFKADQHRVMSVAVHPTQPYVLSGGFMEIKLWDWENGWQHKRTFKEHSGFVRAIAFNPEDNNCFASASDDGTIKVWSLGSPESKYTLSGHSDSVWSLDFFTRDGQQYLITGSNDKTAKIWDMQLKECVRTLPHASPVWSVFSHPKHPLLVTGTWSGEVYFWSSTNFRLKRILRICGRSWVRGLACLNESGRVAVAHYKGLLVIEIREEEEQGGSSSNNENSISATD